MIRRGVNDQKIALPTMPVSPRGFGWPETRGSLSAYSLPVMQVQGGSRGRAERELFIALYGQNDGGFQLQSDSC